MRGLHGEREDGTAGARCGGAEAALTSLGESAARGAIDGVRGGEAGYRCRGEGAAGGHPPGVRRYEALGRVMAALAGETEMLQACRDLAWWRGNDHSWHVVWRDGPHAAEVAALLVNRIRGPEGKTPLAGLTGAATVSTASLDVMGVSFVLLAIDPLGMDRLRARPGLWRLSAALDGVLRDGRATGATTERVVGDGTRGRARRSSSRRCWEELLGG